MVYFSPQFKCMVILLVVFGWLAIKVSANNIIFKIYGRTNANVRILNERLENVRVWYVELYSVFLSSSSVA